MAMAGGVALAAAAAAAAANAVGDAPRGDAVMIDMVNSSKSSVSMPPSSSSERTFQQAMPVAEAGDEAVSARLRARPEDPFEGGSTLWDWIVARFEQLADSDYRVLMQWARVIVPLALMVVLVFVLQHIPEVLTALWLAYAVMHGNSVVRTERAQRERGNVRPLLITVATYALHISVAIFLFPSAFFSKSSYGLLAASSLWESFWYSLLVDLLLTEATIGLKALCCIGFIFSPKFPHARPLLSTIELASQVIRTVMPLRAWLPYLMTPASFTTPLLAILLPLFYVGYKVASLYYVSHAFVATAMTFGQVTLGRRAAPEDLVHMDGKCSICQDDLQRPLILSCRHVFCEDCVSEWVSRQHSCPNCRSPTMHRGPEIAWGDGATQAAPMMF